MTKVRINSLLVMFVDVGDWHLAQFIHKKITCSSHLQLKILKDASVQNLIVIGHTHRLEASVTIGVGLCANMVINTKSVEIRTIMKSIHHSRLPSPLQPRN